MSFIDKCKIFVKAGNGGNGMMAWRREAHVPLGGPAGGNGGNGGNVYFVGDKNETSLEHLKYKKTIIAKDGENGDIKNMHGKNAQDLFVNVPLGTVVINQKTNEIICDIKNDKQKYLIAKGGNGGKGNAFFKSSFNKAPTLYENGDLGEEFELLLELKELADIGIVGFPNAGKSTLISKLTNAKPKIADYMFTTLVPILGTIDYHDSKIILADIPGLIENACLGYGLGFEFLKHIERCKILIHLISLSDDDNVDIIDAYKKIINELKKYNQKLLDKKIILIANKKDCLNADKKIKKLEKFLNQKVFAISCFNDQDILKLKNLILKEYEKINLNSDFEIHPVLWKNNDEEKKLDTTLQITKIDENVWDIKSEYLKYWTHKIPLNTKDNIIRFNQKLAKLEIEKKLYELGAKSTDTVLIYGNEISLNEYE